MHKYQRACCFRPSTVPHIATVAFLAGLGHALMLLPCDSNGEIYVADGRAVLHSSVLLQCVMDIYQEGGTADSYSTVRLDVATEELLTLAQFMNDVDDIVDACQWVTQNIPEHTEAEQIRRLLSAANRLGIHLFIITVGISLPLPGTQMRVLPPLEFFRERLALPTLNTVGPAITDPDFDRSSADCSICLERRPSEAIRALTCASHTLHRFHQRCIDRWILVYGHNSCPICRRRIAHQCSRTVRVPSPQGDFEIEKCYVDHVLTGWQISHYG